MIRIQKLLELLEESPCDCFVMHALGLEYVKLNNLEQAEFFFTKLLEIDPNYVGTYYHLAKLYEQKNQLNKAINTYQTGVDVAKKIKDKHALAELEAALWEIDDEL